MRPSQRQFETRISTNASTGHSIWLWTDALCPCRAPDMTFGLTLSPSLYLLLLLLVLLLCLKVTCFYSWPCCSSTSTCSSSSSSSHFLLPEIIIYEFALLSPFWKWSESQSGPNRIASDRIVLIVVSYLRLSATAQSEFHLCVFTFSLKSKFHNKSNHLYAVQCVIWP